MEVSFQVSKRLLQFQVSSLFASCLWIEACVNSLLLLLSLLPGTSTLPSWALTLQ